MITITNDNVAGFDPRWAPFRGFSLLFDNPGEGLRVTDWLGFIDCRPGADPDLKLYKALEDGIEHVGRDFLTHTFLLCLLPPASYHVTVWDGVNDANLPHVTEAYRGSCGQFLGELPGSLRASGPFSVIHDSALVRHRPWNIQLRFERIENWSDISLVAVLVPADDESTAALQSLKDVRAGLSDAFEQTFGVRPTDTYVPHVTLGYFADRGLAAQVMPHLETWNSAFQTTATGLSLKVDSVGLYGFTDMATFFKRMPA